MKKSKSTFYSQEFKWKVVQEVLIDKIPAMLDDCKITTTRDFIPLGLGWTLTIF